jgi:O-antigen ligase
MRLLIPVLLVIIILGVIVAIDEPQINHIYYLIGIFFIWMIIRLFYGGAIWFPVLIIPFILFLFLQSLLFINGPQTPLGFQWLSANLFFILFLILSVDLMKIFIKPLHWEDTVLLFGISACLLAYVEIILWYRDWWEIARNLSPPVGAPRPGSFVSHAVSLAGIINIVWPIAFFRSWKISSINLKFIYYSILVLLFVGLYFTATRTAWGIAFIQIVIISLFFISPYKPGFKIRFMIKRITIPKRRLFVIGIIGAIILITTCFLAINRVIETGRNITTLSGRGERWAIAWELIKSSPIVGHGIGTFPMEYAALMPKWQNAGNNAPQALNMFIHNGAETGFVGVFLILMILGLTVRTFVRTWKINMYDRIESKRIIIYFAIGLSILFHNQFEFLFSYGHNSVYALIVVIFLALILFYSPKTEFRLLSFKVLFPSISIFFILLIFGAKQIWAGYDQYRNGIELANIDEIELARDKICSAVEENPNNAFFYFQCSLAYAELAFQNKSYTLLNEAIEYQEMGLELDPFLAVNWLNLGILQWEIGNQNDALKSMRHASNIDAKPIKNRDPMIYLNLARIADELGYEKEAYEYYKYGLESNPLIEFRSASNIEYYQVDISKYFIELWGDDLWKAWMAYMNGANSEAVKYINLALTGSLKTRSAYAFAYGLLAVIQNDLGYRADADMNIQKALFISKSSKILAMAGHIYRMNGKYTEASEMLLKVIEKSQKNSRIWGYYYFQYQEANSSIYSPLLLSTDFQEAMINDLVWLSDYQEHLGNYKIAREVKAWIQYNSP